MYNHMKLPRVPELDMFKRGLPSSKDFGEDKQSFIEASSQKDHNQPSNKDKAQYQCSLCEPPRPFKRKFNLKHHVKFVHTEQPTFKCSHDGCQATFKRSTDKTRHVTSCHEPRQFVCICTKEFDRNDSLKRYNRMIFRTHVCS
jgi:hypothetical protein